MGQIEQIYGADAKTLIDNAGVLQVFGATNQAAADRISELTGWSAPILGIPSNRQIISAAGAAPRLAERLNYLTDPRYAGLYRDNPFYAREVETQTPIHRPVCKGVDLS